MYDNLPSELKTGHRFVCWELQERDGKKTKVPMSPHGGLAKVNNPETWGTFHEAVAYYEKKRLNGIGVVLSNGSKDKLVGIDLDHCIDEVGGLTRQAEEIVEVLNSYTEITPSGRGLRIFVKGELPDGARRKGTVEIYDNLRYLTLTGNHLKGTQTTIEARQDELIKVWNKFVSPLTPGTERPADGTKIPDDGLLRVAMNAKNGPAFKRLWAGDFSDYPSHVNTVPNCLFFTGI